MSNDEEDENSSIEETSEDDDEAEKSEKNHFEDLRSSEAYKTLCEDFEPEVVLASLIECGTQDIDDLTGWCLSDHLDDQVQDILKGHLLRMKIDSSSATAEFFSKPSDEKSPNSKFRSQPSTNLVRFSFDVKAEGHLSDKLKEIWNQFLAKVESLEITDYLSFQSLARCLEELNEKHGRNPERKFSNTFSSGTANLVVCCEEEMYELALSFYMLDYDKPLPCLDEILICQNDTPLEQIELICRRAFNDVSGKIYIVMHAERIKFDNGMQIEQLFKNTTVSVNHKYRLIFMASKEHNDNSYIVTSFDKNRIQVATLPRDGTTAKYLLHHLQSQPISADPDTARMRIVKSLQAGNGKSLVAQRLSQRIRNCERRVLQLHDSDVCYNKIISAWMRQVKRSKINVFHLDLTPAVRNGRADLIFSLSVLGGLADSSGQVWLCSEEVYYIIELTSIPDTATELDKVLFVFLLLHTLSLS